MPPSPPFGRLQFGETDALREAERTPRLLLDGFYDPADIAGELLQGDTCILLGPKGSGKSAIVEHLELRHAASRDVEVKRFDLYEFPYTDFVSIESGGRDEAARLPGSWRWVLLLALIDSFSGDVASPSRNSPEFQKAVDVLTKTGFLPALRLREVVLESSALSIGAALKGLAGGWTKSRQNRGLAMGAATETLQRLVEDFRSETHHLVVLDGLDKQFASGQVPWEPLAALVVAVDDLNSRLRRSGAPAKLALLIRPDMFDRLPSAEVPKIRQHSGRLLNWYSPTPTNSELFDLFQKKASVDEPGLPSIVDSYFPKIVTPRGGVAAIPIHEYLIERTRHTPRDLGSCSRPLRELPRGRARRAG